MNLEEALQQAGRAGSKRAMFRSAAFGVQFSSKKQTAQKTAENWQGKGDQGSQFLHGAVLKSASSLATTGFKGRLTLDPPF